MDELSPIFQDIEFRVTLRGYDVDQVDAYIDRVAKAAALVQGRLGELQVRTESAESRLVPAEHTDTETSLSRTLILAQRTADAAVAEAREEAAKILAEAHEARSLLATELEADTNAARRAADDYASRVRAEADTDRRRMLDDAEAAASAAANGERDRLAEEVAELEQYRAFLNDDVAILETHLLDQRAALAASVSALTDLIQAPDGFRLTPAPETSGAILSLADPAVPAVAETDLGSDIAEMPDIAEEHAVAKEAVIEPAEPEVVEDAPAAEVDAVLAPRSAAEVTFEAWADPVAIDLTAGAQSRTESSDFFEEFERTGDFAIVDVAGELDSVPATIPGETAGDAVTVTVPPLLSTAADFDVKADSVQVETVEPAAVHPDRLLFEDPVESQPADPFLDQLREAASNSEPSDFGDEALSAFFEHDDVNDERGWFG